MASLLRSTLGLLLLSVLSLSSDALPASNSANGMGDNNAVQPDYVAAIKQKCGFNEGETNTHNMKKQDACVNKALQIYRERARMDAAIARAATIRANQPAPAPAAASVHGLAAPPAPPVAAPSPNPSSQPGGAISPMVGGSLSGTPSTCGSGSGSNNPTLIRVHRTIMTPKVAADDFGYRLGRRFIVYQVTVENYSKDYQYMLEDVSIDFSQYLGYPSTTYQFNASSQDLSLLRGVPEKGADLDPRNAILHVLQGIGSVAGGISGLTSFGDVMGPAIALFNGSFIQGYSAIAPDHSGTQLNRLSDSAFSADSIIAKQRSKTIAIFIPADEVLSKEEQKDYWKDPNSFVSLQGSGSILNSADVCVDGTFIQAVTVSAPTLSTATLGNIVMPLPGASTSLAVTGSNLVQGDTQAIIGTGATSTKSMLATTDGKNGTAQVTLPPDYTSSGTTVILQSVTNPSLTSGAPGVKLTVFTLAAPTLASAVSSETPGQSVNTNLTLTGTNFVQGDTEAIIGMGANKVTAMVNTTDGTTGKVLGIALPSDYSVATTAVLQSKSNPALKSDAAGVKLTTAP